MRRRGWITAIALAACAMLLSMGAFADDVSYIKYEYTYSESGGSYLMGEKAYLSDGNYTIVDGNYEYSSPWTGAYVVVGNVEITERIKVSGEADLILTDGCTLTASAGISVTNGNTLNIYGQSEGDGALTATGATASGTKGAAGIGGEYAADEASLCGTINIHGGVITARGENYNDALSGVKGMGGAGIGNGYSTNGGLPVSGEINIFDGKVTATGATQGGAGIGGGGHDGTLDSIKITGGVITATGHKTVDGGGSAHAIGGGANKTAADDESFDNCIIIDGATDTAYIYIGTGIEIYDGFAPVELPDNITIPADTSMTVPAGETLTVNGNLTVEGTLDIKGGIVINGSATVAEGGNLTINAGSDGDSQISSVENLLALNQIVDAGYGFSGHTLALT